MRNVNSASRESIIKPKQAAGTARLRIQLYRGKIRLSGFALGRCFKEQL